MISRKLLFIFFVIVNFNGYAQESSICNCNIDYTLILAEQGDINETNRLKDLYPKLISLAKEGNAEAQYMLGVMYNKGIVVKNSIKSYILLSLAKGRTNNKNNEIYLLFLLDGFTSKFNNELTSSDIKQAKSFIQQCIDSNYKVCNIDKVNFKNSKQSNSIQLIQLAQQGNAKAQNSMGDSYFRGEGVDKDLQQALNWYTLAAKQGNADAQQRLGIIYLFGSDDFNIAKDNINSYKWNLLAEKNGKDVKAKLEFLAEEMSEMAIEQAQRLAKQCLDSNYQDCD